MRLLLALCAAAAACLVSSAVASASYIHPFVKTFGSFSSVQGVAVDSSTGDVYVYDGGRSELLKFNAAGEPANFSASGTNVIEGLDYRNNSNGEIAVDNSSGPAKGDIYVATVNTPTTHEPGAEVFGGTEIGIYSDTGEKLGGLNNEPSPIGKPCGVAVDPSGEVYVSLIGTEEIAVYAPKANPVTKADFVSAAGGLHDVCQVSVDSLGNGYWADWRDGPVDRVTADQFGSSSSTFSVIDKTGSSLAVDPSTDEVYVNERSRVAQFGVHGEPFEAPVSVFAAEGPGGISDATGIAVSGFNRDVYVSNGSSIGVFGPLAVVATVETSGASNVEAHSMTVSGTVNPEGLAVSECFVEYGSSTAYGHSQPCVQSPAQIGSGSGAVAVQANLSGLTPGTLYHYRFVATDVHGRGEGADRSLALPGPPALSGESFSELYEVEVNLRAQIDPDFSSTTYHLDYGTSAAYGQSTPESQSIGSDSGLRPVLVHLAGLAPGTTYHFQFVATNSFGTSYGEDAQFTTFPAPVSPPPGEGGGSSQPVPAGGECLGSQCETGLSTTPTFDSVHWEAAKPRPKALTRAQKLARALKICRRKHGRARRRCEATARKRYGASKPARRR